MILRIPLPGKPFRFLQFQFNLTLKTLASGVQSILQTELSQIVTP